MDSFSVVDRKAHNITMTIKGAMYISLNDLSLNRNIGKLWLYHIWNEVLFNNPALHLK